MQEYINKEDRIELNFILGLSFFINWFTAFFIENLGTEDEIKIKIKYNSST